MFSATLLKEKRTERNMSQSALAKAVGTGNAQICKWESGKTKPDVRSIRKLSAYFGVHEDFWDRPGGKIGETPSKRDVIEKVDALKTRLEYLEQQLNDRMGILEELVTEYANSVDQLKKKLDEISDSQKTVSVDVNAYRNDDIVIQALALAVVNARKGETV